MNDFNDFNHMLELIKNSIILEKVWHTLFIIISLFSSPVCLAMYRNSKERFAIDQLQFQFLFQLENKLLQFHLGNLEFSCAAPLSKVSLLSWDQNEAFPQFSGDHTLLQHGFGALLNKLAQNLDIKLQYEVRL